MAYSSPSSQKCDVFPSFSGEDVRRGFLSHLLKEFERKAINTFIDNGIERSGSIGPELISAIREARISIVIFSKNYATSRWCLNELVEVYKSYKELNQKVIIPVFYQVEPSEVRKQNGEFGKYFMKTCEGKTDDVIQRWKEALTDVANLAGEHLSNGRRYDVFPSFSGVDVRRGFLSYLLKEFNRKAINSFIDNGIERSHQIADELLLAINQARIAVVIFSKNYASSTWCLDELVEIHKCSKELKQMVIPVFYYVDPSNVRKQKGEFGESFLKTCEGKTDDEIQRWKQALKDVADLAGEHLGNGPSEADMVEKIANDVSNKLLSPSMGFGDLVGIEAHIEAMKSILCLESKEPRMTGIWGQSGIGKSTLGRSLFSHLSLYFDFHNFSTDKPMDKDVAGMKLKWEKEFLSEILNQKELKIENFGEVKKRLNSKKVLIVLDDVVNREFLETLVGKTEWFGPGSRIIVITQDTHILKGHKIDHLYEVKIPAQDIALKMLCRYAFGQDSPPDDFEELAAEVAKVAGHLPLGLSVLGSSLKGRTKEEWMRFLPGLQNGLKGDIMNTLKVSYDRLDEEEQDIFLYIASLFNGRSIKCINGFFGDGNGCVEIMLKRLAEKSLIRITSNEKFDGFRDLTGNEEIVEMHNLLEKLGKEIVRGESKSNPGKRRFLTDAEEIQDVLTNQTGTETVLGIVVDKLKSHIPLDEKSFEGMSNLKFLEIIYPFFCWPSEATRLAYLPPKLKWLFWNYCRLKCLPSNFKAEFLVELRMSYSNLEKLWEGTQQLQSLKTIIMSFCENLKEIPDLSKAINLERVDISECVNLESFPSPLNSRSLEYLNLTGCYRLKNFPEIRMESLPHGIVITVYDCLWNKNLPGLDYLDCLRRCYPIKFLPEHLVYLLVRGNKMEKLWEGVQSLGSLKWMNLTESENLKEIPDLSKATNFTYLNLSHCKSLVEFPSTIGNLQKLEILEMEECTMLEVLPVDINLSSLKTLNFNGCSSLKSFPQISSSIEELNIGNTAIEKVPCCIKMFRRLTKLSMSGCSCLKTFPQLSHSIEELNLDYTSIEEFPCCIEMLRRLTKLSMHRCSKLKNISPKIFRLTNLKEVDFTDCGGFITMLSDATIKNPYETIEKGNKVENRRDEDEYDDDKESNQDGYYHNRCYFKFHNCLNLDKDARELIMQSSLKWTMVIPGGEVPTYFNHRAYGNSLIVTLPQSSLSHNFLRFNVCVVVAWPATFSSSLDLDIRFDGLIYKHAVDVGTSFILKDHLVLFSFKLQSTGLTSKLNSKDVEFKFKRKIKEFGIRLLNASPALDDSDVRRSEIEYNQDPGENCVVVETESSNKQMQMTSFTSPNMGLSSLLGESPSISSYPCREGEGKISEQQDEQIPIVDPEPEVTSSSSCSANSEEDFNLTSDQIVTYTTMPSPNMELSSGWGESSSVSSYLCPDQGEALYIDSMTTEHKDAQDPTTGIPEPDLTWQPSCSASSSRASIFCCWKGLLKRKKKEKKIC